MNQFQEKKEKIKKQLKEDIKKSTYTIPYISLNSIFFKFAFGFLMVSSPTFFSVLHETEVPTTTSVSEAETLFYVFEDAFITIGSIFSVLTFFIGLIFFITALKDFHYYGTQGNSGGKAYHKSFKLYKEKKLYYIALYKEFENNDFFKSQTEKYVAELTDNEKKLIQKINDKDLLDNYNDIKKLFETKERQKIEKLEKEKIEINKKIKASKEAIGEEDNTIQIFNE